MTEERLAEYRGNPVDNLEPLARQSIVRETAGRCQADGKTGPAGSRRDH